MKQPNDGPTKQQQLEQILKQSQEETDELIQKYNKFLEDNSILEKEQSQQSESRVARDRGQDDEENLGTDGCLSNQMLSSSKPAQQPGFVQEYAAPHSPALHNYFSDDRESQPIRAQPASAQQYDDDFFGTSSTTYLF